MEGSGTRELQPLTEEQVLQEGWDLQEGASRLVVPDKGGIIREDGTVRLDVIRPCVSRGKRLRGLPPIYTAQMLAENAAVFTDWHMFMDHLTEALAELLQEKGRSVKELGGRILKSWYDPTISRPWDDDFGYQTGAVVADAIPYPAAKALLEADPQSLHVSINAWPKSAKPGPAPWAPAVEGMIVEGIRRVPRGSVDWVLRGGAGGRPVAEAEEFAVSVLERLYDSAPAAEMTGINLTELLKKPLEEQQAYLREHAPELAESLTEKKADPAKADPPKTDPPAAGALTEERVQEMIREAHQEGRQEVEGKLEERAEEIAEELIEEREEARELEKLAARLIESSGLPRSFQADLRSRYCVLPSGPTQGLLVEAEEAEVEEDGKTVTKNLTAEQMLERNVREDIEDAYEKVREAGGKPAVRGFGASRTDPGGEGRGSRQAPNAFRDFLRESGDLRKRGDEAPKEEDVIREMVEG